MNKKAIAALRGTLRSRRSTKAGATAADESPGSLTVQNLLPIAVYVYYLDEMGQQSQVCDSEGNPEIFAAGETSTVTLLTGEYVFKTVFSGSFAAQFAFVYTDGTSSITLSPSNIPSPNDIGLFPTPTTEAPIPLDSPLVLVGCATLPNGNAICREQYWARAPDSYVLAPGTKRTVATTLTTGIQQISSHQEDVSKALGFSASAGWGPISASVSGSLSTNSSTYQQLMLNSQTTQYESLELINKTDVGQMYLKWQLVNVITILAPTTSGDQQVRTAVGALSPPNGPGGQGPIASIVTAESPILIDGPYDPKNLPLPPTP